METEANLGDENNSWQQLIDKKKTKRGEITDESPGERNFGNLISTWTSSVETQQRLPVLRALTPGRHERRVESALVRAAPAVYVWLAVRPLK